MKRAAMFIVALVVMATAAVQAADTSMVIYSHQSDVVFTKDSDFVKQAYNLASEADSYRGDEALNTADDVHFVISKADDLSVVAEGDGAANELTLDNGNYVISAEQPSTGFYGSLSITVTDSQPAPRRFCLVGQVDANGNVVSSVLIELIDGQDDPAAVAAADTATPAQSTATTPANTPSLPQYPNGYNGYGYGNGYGGWGALGVLGAMGAVIAVACADDNNNPRPVTPAK